MNESNVRKGTVIGWSSLVANKGLTNEMPGKEKSLDGLDKIQLKDERIKCQERQSLDGLDKIQLNDE